jgi:ABC-2 type transport system ATP-binding protein
MISVKSVEKRYGDAVAVSGLSFDVQRGEIVGLLGHNGAGKTTIMKVMTGYLEPSAGSVEIDGRDVVKDRLAVQRSIGYLPENAPLYPELQVQEYLSLMAELRGIKGKAREEAIREALEATGLTARRRQTIQTLSKGFRQRVGLAQAILHKPELLILDEPTNGLDPVQILEIRALIKRLAEHTTILLSTHILSEIEAVCDRVVILIQGELAADASLEELMSSDELRVTVRGAKSAAQVIKRLGAVEGVAALTELSASGAERVQLSVKPSPSPEGERPKLDELAERLHEAVSEAGWAVSHLARYEQSLEEIFRELMGRHVSRQQAAEASLDLKHDSEQS